MQTAQVSTIVLPSIINTALMYGVNIDKILQNQGISVDLVDITHSTIELKQLHAIVMDVEKASAIPTITLEIGKAFAFEYLPNVKTLLMTASTLREAIRVVHKLKQLVTSLLNIHLVETKSDAKLILNPEVDLSSEDDRYFTEMVFSVYKNIFTGLLRGDYSLNPVRFRHKEFHLRPSYENFFKSDVELGSPENVLTFNSDILDEPLPGGFPAVHRQAEALVDEEVLNSPLQQSFVLEIAQLFKRKKALLSSSIEEISDILRMSPRTLQRRLTEEGTSFKALRDQVKYHMATQALKSGQDSIEDIGDDLGFSDRHSFTRAFKRWSGLSPSTYRSNIQK